MSLMRRVRHMADTFMAQSQNADMRDRTHCPMKPTSMLVPLSYNSNRKTHLRQDM